MMGSGNINDNTTTTSSTSNQLHEQGQRPGQRRRSRYVILITYLALFGCISIYYSRRDFRLFLPSSSTASSSTTSTSSNSSTATTTTTTSSTSSWVLSTKSTSTRSKTSSSSGQQQQEPPNYYYNNGFNKNSTVSLNNDNYCFYESTSLKCCSKEHCDNVVKKSTMASKCCNTSLPTWPLLITGTPRSGTVYINTALQTIGLKVHDDWGNPFQDGMVSWIHIMYERNNDYFGPGKIPNGGKFATIYHLVRDPLKSITSIAFTEPLLKNPRYLKYLKRHIPMNTTKQIPQNAIMKEQAKAQKQQQKQRQKQLQAQRNKNTKKKNDDEKNHDNTNGNDNDNNDVEFSNIKLSLALEFYIQWHTFIDTLHVPRFKLEDFSPDIVWDIYQTSGFVNKYANSTLTQQKIQQQIYNFFHSPKVSQVKNSRKHRSTVTWNELCNVNTQLTNEFWTLVRGYGYYLDMDNKQPC